MTGSVRSVRVIRVIAQVIVAAALGLGQGGCLAGDDSECINDDASCVQEVLDEAGCLQRDYCMLGPGCHATACSPLVNDEAACRASGVCNWNSIPELAQVGCGSAASWSECERVTTESACTAQHEGCNWERTCVLKPRDCTQLDDQATCQSRPACKWVRGTSRFQLG